MSNNVYQIVTDRICEQLRRGVISWQKPWIVSSGGKFNRNVAISWTTGREYNGINRLLLDAGEYATFMAITNAGGHVKRGAQGSMVVFWKLIEGKQTDDQGNEETKQIPYLRYFTVFNALTQVEGLKPRAKTEILDATTDPEPEIDPITEAEAIVHAYKGKPTIQCAPNRAFYSPTLDYISVPPLKDYREPQEYYSTLFHEMIHSTGHKDRLHRECCGVAAFGGETYCKEELAAEIGGAFLCAVAGIEQGTLSNSTSYIKGWLRKLRNDPKMIVFAAAASEKAADYIQGVI
jgi:antirestriction protein ArdC